MGRGRDEFSLWKRSAGRVSVLVMVSRKCKLGEVNVSREFKGRDSCVCQESCVDAIYMEESCQGQIETGLHFFDVCVAVNVAQVLEKVR